MSDVDYNIDNMSDASKVRKVIQYSFNPDKLMDFLTTIEVAEANRLVKLALAEETLNNTAYQNLTRIRTEIALFRLNSLQKDVNENILVRGTTEDQDIIPEEEMLPADAIPTEKEREEEKKKAKKRKRKKVEEPAVEKKFSVRTDEERANTRKFAKHGVMSEEEKQEEESKRKAKEVKEHTGPRRKLSIREAEEIIAEKKNEVVQLRTRVAVTINKVDIAANTIIRVPKKIAPSLVETGNYDWVEE